MRNLSRRARLLLATSVTAVLGSGLVGALVMPASAHTAAVAKPVAASSPILSVCVTVTQVHLGPVCLKI